MDKIKKIKIEITKTEKVIKSETEKLKSLKEQLSNLESISKNQTELDFSYLESI